MVTSDNSTTSNWPRQQFHKALQHLAQHGILPEGVTVTESRLLEPLVAIWKISATRPKPASYWVLSGDLPTDVASASAAASPRDALRYFALHWQLKAEQLRSAPAADAAQLDYAALLEGRASSLYQIFDNTRLWSEADRR